MTARAATLAAHSAPPRAAIWERANRELMAAHRLELPYGMVVSPPTVVTTVTSQPDPAER